MQTFCFLNGNDVSERQVPPAEADVIPGVPWGRLDELFTPAYWLTQYWLSEQDFVRLTHRIGRTFEEEVAACMLGGHGIPAEVGLAAFERLRDAGLITQPMVSAEVISDCLRRPLVIRGRTVVYRFWSQKAAYLSATLQLLRRQELLTESGRALRDQLMNMPGIGPKTASWIVRNWLGSNDVAILDVHVVRAGRLMGIYSTDDRVERSYRSMESRFLDLAAAMQVSASNLDSMIWGKMRQSPRLVASLIDPPTSDQCNTNPSRNRRSKQALLQRA